MRKKFTIAVTSIICVLLVSICAYASQENNLDIFKPDQNECEITTGHKFEIVSFEKGLVEGKCSNCDKIIQENFMDYINSDYELLDVVDDGVVNAKDYAKLCREYKND